MSISEERVAEIKSRMAACLDSVRRGVRVDPAEILDAAYESAMETEELNTEARVERLLLLAQLYRIVDPIGAIALLRVAAKLSPEWRGWIRRYEEEILKSRGAAQTAVPKPKRKKRRRRTPCRNPRT
jgi:hypothetical protein